MAAVAVPPGNQNVAPEWSRKYPPLFAVVVAALLALVVLPSSLNLPQTNPTQTLEYAPVPPDKNVDSPPQGNLAAVGLGSSQGVEGGGASGGDDGGAPVTEPGTPPSNAIAAPPPVRSDNPTKYRCVGNPPRQTEDPGSPPCVAFFEGDNFGATYQGVTGDEIRLLVYIDGDISETGGSQARADRPTEKYFDLFAPPKEGDDDENHLIVKGMRVWQRYFNERFQTYNRRVHFYLYFTGFDHEPENRRADAADNYLKIKPFAVLTYAEDNEIDYIEAMSKKGVLNFGSYAFRPTEFFNRYPKLVWGFQPTVETQADQYASYVCQKVVPNVAVLNGNSDSIPGSDAGKPRKLGMIHTVDKTRPGHLLMAQLVKEKVAACGGKIEEVATFSKCCYSQDVNGESQQAAQYMAEFQQKGITTILWAGGQEGNFGRAAQSIGYQPEWIVLGDGVMEGNHPTRLSNNTGAFDRRAIVVTPVIYKPAQEQQRCAQAFREVDPEFPGADLGFICEYYDNLLQIFTGIQVAGPRLGPTSIDKGFHAIPQRRSSSATLPACFYLSNDYTCVKDAQAEIWDAAAQAPGDNRPGCWRSIGVLPANPDASDNRSLPNEWPDGNINAQITGNEPCNAHNVGSLLRTAPET